MLKDINNRLCEFRGGKNSAEKVPWRWHQISVQKMGSIKIGKHRGMKVILGGMKPNGLTLGSPIIYPAQCHGSKTRLEASPYCLGNKSNLQMLGNFTT